MKILVSSKAFADFLSQVDFNNDYVDTLRISHNLLHLRLSTKSICVRVESPDINTLCVCQDSVKWAKIYSIIRMMDERPIVFEFNDNMAKLIVDFN